MGLSNRAVRPHMESLYEANDVLIGTCNLFYKFSHINEIPRERGSRLAIDCVTITLINVPYPNFVPWNQDKKKNHTYTCIIMWLNIRIDIWTAKLVNVKRKTGTFLFTIICKLRDYGPRNKSFSFSCITEKMEVLFC